ncbi:MAG: 2Fe-2S iron-sulfur cluster-binding protein [Pirellulales bacterium]|jgi:ferredoxin|tara:strand:- start:139 stop:471 length:333 start_codon:yes stop_codon:yes gene_type:complete
MPKLDVEGLGEFEVPADKRLVLALVDEANVDQLHACGGNGKCTTCQVEILGGDAGEMNSREQETLTARELSGVRLSCQIVCKSDLQVRVLKRLEGSGRADAGARPADTIS